MVWSVFNYLLTQKLPRKANVALGCSQCKKLLKTLKVAQKLPSTIHLYIPNVMKLTLREKVYVICVSTSSGKRTLVHGSRWRDSRDHLRLVITKPGRGGGTAIYGLYRYVPL